MIKKAKPSDSKTVTDLAIKSKMYWKYSESVMDVFREELIISSEYIKTSNVWIYEKKGEIIGFYTLKFREKEFKFEDIVLKIGYWLDHMFILPEYIGQGFGKLLFNHFSTICQTINIEEVMILADPNAKKFYEKMGCEYIKEYTSSIPNRTTPYLLFHPNIMAN